MRQLLNLMTVCCLIGMISCVSCQKPEEITSAGDSAASPNAVVETNTPVNDAAEPANKAEPARIAEPAKIAEPESNDASPDMTGFLRGFEPYGLSANTAKPSFAKGFYTPNGDRASLYKGKTVYMKIDESVPEEAFLKYCQDIFTEIQATADNHTIYQYKLATQTRGDVIQKIDQASIGTPVEMFWTKDGKNLALYTNIREYQSHYLMECQSPCKALYLSINEI